MGEVLDFMPAEKVPAFTLHAHKDGEGMWAVSVTEFYDSKVPVHEMFREIADALVGIAGGMIHNAESLEPTSRGCMMSHIALYEDGYAELKTAPLDTPARKAWLIQALENIRDGILAGKLDK